MSHTKFNTKRKGDVGLTRVIAWLTEQEWNVSLPISESCKYDLVAEKNGKCYTVQVRYTTSKDGVMPVKLKNSWADKRGNHTRVRKPGDYDVLAVYEPNSKNCYFLKDENFSNQTQINLRLNDAKNCQEKNIKMARNYMKLLS